ncbi:MAG TPA: hypothetical protein VGR35_16800 [Tepidisphaeraceae bacterium]|nr:hypothetical protein [Tepidisphaeraceae bacterium]
MPTSDAPFQRSVDQQIAVNRARTPTQRFEALCELLDFARAMAPSDAAARERRRKALAARQHEREQWREQCRRLAAADRAGHAAGV